MKRGFTLIELLVVVLIIGILSAVALPQYTKAVEKSYATEAITWLGNMVKAEQVYRLANGTYTLYINRLDVDFPGIANIQGDTTFFRVNNFRIAVQEANTVQFKLRAKRTTRTGGNKTGDSAYVLVVSVDQNGNITRSCVGAEKTCKVIGSGAVCSSSGTNKDWCYDPTGSY